MYLKTEPRRRNYWPLFWLTLCLVVAGCAGKYEWTPFEHPVPESTIEWLAVCGRPTANANPEICTRKIPSESYKWIMGVRAQQYLIRTRYDK